MTKITETNKPKSINQYEINHFARLGKEIKISPKANITVNKAGFKTEFLLKQLVY